MPKQEMTPDEEDAARDNDPNWGPMGEEDDSIDSFIVSDDDPIEEAAFHLWFRSLSQNVKARYFRDDNFATQLRADYARQQVVDVDLQNEHGLSV